MSIEIQCFIRFKATTWATEKVRMTDVLQGILADAKKNKFSTIKDTLSEDGRRLAFLSWHYFCVLIKLLTCIVKYILKEYSGVLQNSGRKNTLKVTCVACLYCIERAKHVISVKRSKNWKISIKMNRSWKIMFKPLVPADQRCKLKNKFQLIYVCKSWENEWNSRRVTLSWSEAAYVFDWFRNESLVLIGWL